MNRDQKNQEIQDLKEKFDSATFFYLTDASAMTVADVNKFRRLCFDRGVEMRVVKNTLVRKALETNEEKGFDQLYDHLHGPTAILFSETGNIPAKLIEEFRKKSPKPVLKAAYIDSAVFVGDDQISILTKLKSKEELVGDIIGLLQSPAKRVIGALQANAEKKDAA